MAAKDDWDFHKLAKQLAGAVWQSVRDWDYFTQDKLGREVAKATDSLLGTVAPGPPPEQQESAAGSREAGVESPAIIPPGRPANAPASSPQATAGAVAPPAAAPLPDPEPRAPALPRPVAAPPPPRPTPEPPNLPAAATQAAADFWNSIPNPEAEPLIEPEPAAPLDFDASQSEGYGYFMSEAQDLLVEIEQQLLTLSPSKETNEIYTLMRATHTLKGAAANVGQETIKTVAHQLEDIFRALLVPAARLDDELQAMLFEGYECLRRSLTAELSHDPSTNADILQRSQAVFERCRAHLGDCFDQESVLPSSSELGFDLTRSIFEVGVSQRLDEFATALREDDDPAHLAQVLRDQAEVFLGLGESLSLPGFQAIATTTLAALEAQPQRQREVAVAAYADFRAAQEAVLAGDRQQGGQPSPELLELAGQALDLNTTLPEPDIFTAAAGFESEFDPGSPFPPDAAPQAWGGEDWDDTPAPLDFGDLDAEALAADSALLEATFGELDWQAEAPEAEALGASAGLEATPWGDHEGDYLDELSIGEGDENPQAGSWEPPPPRPAPPPLPPEPRLTWEQVPPPPAPAPRSPSAPEGTAPLVAKTIRLNLEQLEHLNYLVAELSINQNQLTLRDQQFQQAAQKLDNWLKRHRATLTQLRDRLLETATTLTPSQKLAFTALEETGQLLQAAEDINLLARTAAATVEREQRLSSQLRDNMQAARMVPIATVLNRFPPLIKQLKTAYGKAATLDLQGTKVMVDKTIVENLYDALLHLVRNAFAHGLESDAERRLAGKPVPGQIAIQAYYQGNRTIIDVRDDGRGLDLEGICRQAVAQGLISAAQAQAIRRQPHPEAAVLELLCEPGFSTRTQTDDLAGRGVGLDVVKTQLAAIKGTLTVRSQPGQGTIFSLQIRESLMSARLLVCEAGSGTYSFVSNEIEQVLIPTNGYALHQLAQRRVLDWRQNGHEITVPVYDLTQLLHYPSQRLERLRRLTAGSDGEISPLLSTPANVAPILLLRAGSGLVGLEVSRVIEEQELVIKPLASTLVPPPYVCGCSILANGQLTLVLDGTVLVSQVQTLPAPPALPTGARPPALPAAPASLEPESSRFSTANLGLFVPDTLGATPAATVALEPPQPSPTQPTVLVVDDSLTERQTLSLILQRAGYRVLQAKDGLEAVELLQQGVGVNMVLCDIEMPRMNGLEFLSWLKQEVRGRELPIAILSSRSRDRFQPLVLEMGATAYLTKPYLEQEILAVIREALR